MPCKEHIISKENGKFVKLKEERNKLKQTSMCMPPLMPVKYIINSVNNTLSIWKEHMSVSSTDIMAPALSNSPQ
jgi:hypothetical protein